MKRIDEIIEKQRDFYNSGNTKSIVFRKEMLKRLKETILKYSVSIETALKKDLGKCSLEAYGTETGLILEETNRHIHKLASWSRPKKVKSSMVHFLSHSYIYKEPFGLVLIFGSWNYPFQINLMPLIGSISAGNCAIIKPSEFTPNSSELLSKIIQEAYPEEYVAVVQGAIDESSYLLSQQFEMIFFTGSPKVGQIVYEAASKHLTPVCLELGGKSPCIVDEAAKIELSAKRIIWGKFINAGQTCIAPDYVFAHESVKDKLLERMQFYVEKFYGKNPEQSLDYGRIINTAHLNRLKSLLASGKIIIGGKVIPDQLYFSPTILDEVVPEDIVMKEEIFGPILPILIYNNFEEVKAHINKTPKPLALYYFSENQKNISRALEELPAGSVCINETVMQFGNNYLPFGGLGNSGFGKYHGRYSYDTFTHFKPVLKKSLLIDLPFRYPPYNEMKMRIIKMFLK